MKQIRSQGKHGDKYSPVSDPNTSIQTAPGKYFDYADPRGYEYDIREAAKAVCKICRFNGHTDRFYSVGEHLVIGAWVLERTGVNPQITRSWLLHDLHEAWGGDLPKPKKRLPEMQGAVALEEATQNAFLNHCGTYLDRLTVFGPSVMHLDVVMCCYEAIHLLGDDVQSASWRLIPEPFFAEAREIDPDYLKDFDHGAPHLVEPELLDLLNTYGLIL